MSIGKKHKFCPFPFSRIEHGHKLNEFVPCCYAWFKDEYKETVLKNETEPDIWNSHQAQKLRASILDGSYRYCNLDRCNKPFYSIEEINGADPIHFETPLSPGNEKAILRGETYMPESPSSVSLSSDFKCNLKCPTCRNDYITTTSEYDYQFIQQEIKQLLDAREHVQSIKMANSGEVFFSKDMRALLKQIGPDSFPNLKHIFVITNGLLFDEKTLNQLMPGTQYIKKVAISMDAGNEKTYEKTRGGSWHKLMQNLDWISMKRKKGDFCSFNLNFVVRKENYESIPEFIELGRKLNVDRHEFTKYDDWNSMYQVDLDLIEKYDEEAIHLKNHPDHQKLVDIFSKYKDDKDVSINIDGLFK